MPALHRFARFAVASLALAALTSACTSVFASDTPKARHYSAGCSNRHEIALTFDDGPNPPYTGRILDLLQQEQASATFFIEGEAVAAAPDDVRREVRDGMAIGSHSYAHSKQLPAMSGDQFAADLRRAQAAIIPAAGFTPRFYRAPFGHTSNTMLEELRRAGYVSVGWNIDSRDWSGDSPDVVVRNVLSRAKPGAIVLMHDGGLSGGNPDRSTTIAALPRIIEGLRERGFTLVTVPQLTRMSESQDGTEAAKC